MYDDTRCWFFQALLKWLSRDPFWGCIIKILQCSMLAHNWIAISGGSFYIIIHKQRICFTYTLIFFVSLFPEWIRYFAITNGWSNSIFLYSWKAHQQSSLTLPNTSVCYMINTFASSTHWRSCPFFELRASFLLMSFSSPSFSFFLLSEQYW